MSSIDLLPRHLVLVAIGGAVGTSARWGLLEATAGPDGGSAGPVLFANLLGCGLLGLLLGPPQDGGISRSARLLAGAGFCGGLTTFSTFAVEVARALRDGYLSGAVGYTVLSVAGGLVVFLLGRVIGGRINRTPTAEPTTGGAQC